MTNNLQNILKEIKKNSDIVKAEVLEGENTTRVAKDRQTNAKRRILDLQVDYRNALLARTVFIVLYGPDAKELAKIAENDFGSYAADAESVFNRIADEIPAILYLNKSSSPSLFDVIAHALEGVAAEAGVSEFNSIQYKSSRDAKILKSKDDLKEVIKHTIVNQVGSELLAVHAVTATFMKALETEFDGKVYPVVMYTPDANYAKALVNDIHKHLINHETYTITTSETEKVTKNTIVLDKVSKESVKSALTSIKKSLGGKK